MCPWSAWDSKNRGVPRPWAEQADEMVWNGPLTLLVPKSSYGAQPLEMQPSDPADQAHPSMLMHLWTFQS